MGITPELSNLRLADYQEFTLAANQTFTHVVLFRTCSIISVNIGGVEQTAGTVVMNVNDQSNESKIFGGFYFETNFSDEFVQRCTFRNTTGSSVNVVVVFGAGKTEDRRLQLASTISLATNTSVITGSGATLSSGAALTPGTGGSVLLAASANRRRAWIQNLASSTVSVFVGGSGVTAATGLEVPPGVTVIFDTAAQISGITASGTANVRAMGESI